MECWIYDDTQELKKTQALNFKVLNDNVKRVFEKFGEIQVTLDNGFDHLNVKEVNNCVCACFKKN
jgi:hypothetical protein